ncbi:hypothetical protein [Stenomitos frigidus]|uniref:hypothetical protein n=1 Tax=Stenomitos frigidus TaxID=1886765 RepID=UPI0015E77140|nr:hypothetical protein [Stenomitos frigidus]
MLSFVLPLLVMAIVLTPVIVSARAAYKQEVNEQKSPSDAIDPVSDQVRHQDKVAAS